MAYAMRKNEYITGTQLNLANYNSLFPLIYFDLTYQTENKYCLVLNQKKKKTIYCKIKCGKR